MARPISFGVTRPARTSRETQCLLLLVSMIVWSRSKNATTRGGAASSTSASSGWTASSGTWASVVWEPATTRQGARIAVAAPDAARVATTRVGARRGTRAGRRVASGVPPVDEDLEAEDRDHGPRPPRDAPVGPPRGTEDDMVRDVRVSSIGARGDVRAARERHSPRRRATLSVASLGRREHAAARGARQRNLRRDKPRDDGCWARRGRRTPCRARSTPPRANPRRHDRRRGPSEAFRDPARCARVPGASSFPR